MNMVGHQYVGHEFERPFFPELGKNVYEHTAARCLLEHRKAASNVTGQKV
jgi:hypothetical protein